jgi:hypothetical protein
MSDEGLFDMAPRPPFEPGDRVDLHTLWGVQQGIVAALVNGTPGADVHLMIIAIDGVMHAVDPAHCTFTEETHT